MKHDDLGPLPEPAIQEKEPNPGGVDAIPEDPADVNLARDLSPEDNPVVDEAVPDEIAQLDDKSQAPEGEASDQESGTQDDVSAGQESEDGSVEPPA
jgi:hypothetical protein